MKRSNHLFVLGLALVLGLFTGSAAMAKGGAASVAGTWTLTMTGRRGTFEQTLKLEQNANAVKGTITGRMGETPVKGTVMANDLTFSVTRETPRGTFTMEYKATVDGDSMKGTASNGRFNLEFTGKRTAGSQ